MAEAVAVPAPELEAPEPADQPMQEAPEAPEPVAAAEPEPVAQQQEEAGQGEQPEAPKSEKKPRAPRAKPAAAEAGDKKAGLYDQNPVIQGKRERKQVEVFKPEVVVKSPDKAVLQPVRPPGAWGGCSCSMRRRHEAARPQLSHAPL